MINYKPYYFTIFAVYSAVVVRMDDETLHVAEVVWNYMQLEQRIKGADCMLILGGRDDKVATYAAELSRVHTYGEVVISGGVSHTQDLLVTGWG